MDDMISRQAAIDIIEDFPHGDVWNVESMEEMVDRIKQLPPIQSKLLQPWEVLVAQTVLPQPEIVRCGECKWFQCNMSPDGYLPKGVDEFECRHWCGYCDPTDFCSYAERRTNG